MTRKRAAVKVVPAIQVDHGADGPAMADRPFREVETIAAGVTARQYEDNHLIDRLHRVAQINDRQYEAACKVLEMAGAAGQLLGSSGGWDGGGRQEMSDDMAKAHAKWMALLRSVGAQKADLLMMLVHERHPGVRWLGTLQSTLDLLAKRWGMEG